MHIGTARTALFNWLYAKKNNGKMLFRIEDTDRKRHSEDAVTALKRAMEWLELDWDGDIVSQYESQPRHKEIAHTLLAKGKAYKCFCTSEELDTMRAEAKAEGKPTFYDRRWRENSTHPENTPYVIRIKSPLDGSSTVHDSVQGDITVKNDHLDDFIILRSDGSPTYMLAVVVDDHDMGVTHVIRGDDHINNTFRQNVIYDAMGWNIPHYAHVPLILGPDGAKMSKRHGAASVEEYRDMGYLPEAIRNYLLRLGWSHGDDEIISDAQAIKWFNLKNIGKSPSRFDFDKLEHINAHYIKEADNNRLIKLAKPFLKERHGIELDETGKKRLLEGADELKDRATTLLQFVDEGAFYAKTLPLSYNEKAKTLIQEGKATLKNLIESLCKDNEFTAESVQSTCKDLAKSNHGGKLGKVAMPLRAALTGTTVSPSVFQAAAILGKDETIARLKAAIDIE